MIYEFEVPLPPAALSPNSIAHRVAKADHEAAYKKKCIEIFDTCPIRNAKFVTISLEWHCIADASAKAKPNAKGVVTKTAKLGEPYTPRDAPNAWGAAKYLVDALCDQYEFTYELTKTLPQKRELVEKRLIRQGIIKDDSYRWLACGPCKVMLTQECRKAGIYYAGIKVTLEIEENNTDA